jgi:hypothetical protein
VVDCLVLTICQWFQFVTLSRDTLPLNAFMTKSSVAYLIFQCQQYFH